VLEGWCSNVDTMLGGSKTNTKPAVNLTCSNECETSAEPEPAAASFVLVVRFWSRQS
jgi:hypothetical protein